MQARGIDAERMTHRLRHALQTFDEAAIFTIHGFCQRALVDTPFAAGLPYELELVEDDSALRLEVVQDFWRREVAGGALSPLLAEALLAGKGQPRDLGRHPFAAHGPALCACPVGRSRARAATRARTSAPDWRRPTNLQSAYAAACAAGRRR